MGVGMAERLCVPAFLLSSRVGMTNLRMGMTNPRVGMTYPLSDSSLLLSRQSAQSCDKTTFASIFYCINHRNLCKVLLKSCIFAPEFLQGWAAAR